MTYFMKSGSSWRPTNEENITITKSLPTGTFTVKFDERAGQYYLESIPNMPTVSKLYGDIERKVDRVINTFMDRPNTTGVLLDGEKGAGKTLLAKQISKKLNDLGVITLVINNAWTGEAFNMFIQSIDQPCMIFFDEFEKVYNSTEQQALLTLLDGTYSSKKMFVITTNDRYSINDYMRNRPGRFFYRFEYKGLDEEFIVSYCNDQLNDKSQIPSLVTFSKAFNAFNFDIMKAVVEEMNRYGETVAEVVKYLNASPSIDKTVFEIVNCVNKNTEYNIKKFAELISSGRHVNPFSERMYVTFEEIDSSSSEDDEMDDDEGIYWFGPNDIKEIQNGIYTVETNDLKIQFQRQVTKSVSFQDFMAL